MITYFGRNPTGHRAVGHQGTLYLGGVTAADRTADIGGQTTQILDKISQIVADAGGADARLLTATVYLSDMTHKAAMHDAWTAWFGAADMPARATIGGVDLGPGVLVEVVAIAAAT